MTFLTVANFKSNQTMRAIEPWLAGITPVSGMVIAPSSPHLALAHTNILNLKSTILLAAQDVSPFPSGPYTGGVSAVQLKELGVSYCIVGHSERRRYFHETPVEIASKVEELLKSDITPILCMEQDDIIPQFGALEDDTLREQCLYCFEPASDIGGTVTAPPDLIASVRSRIEDFVPGARFMYGGSVTKDNIADLLPLKLAGVLVATASLDPKHFQAIADSALHGTK